MKHCRKCSQQKTLSEFYYDKRRNNYVAPCKECRKKTVATLNHKWRKDNPDKNKQSDQNSKLKSKYGLSLDGLIAIWEKQNKSCAICCRPISLSATEKSSKPHVDHCHVSGVVRGLLCLTCNTGLGMFGDSTDLLDAAKIYLLRTHLVATELPRPSDSAPVSAESIIKIHTVH